MTDEDRKPDEIEEPASAGPALSSKDVFRSARTRISYYCSYSFLYLTSGIKSFWLGALQPKGFCLGSAVYFVALIAATVLANIQLRIELGVADVASHYGAIGALLAGILAIVFSIRILVVQNAADRSASGLYAIASRDRISSIAFWALAILMLLCLTIALLSSSTDESILPVATVIAEWSLIPIVGTSVWLLFLLYRRVDVVADPNRALRKVEKEAHSLVTQLSKATQSVASVYQKRARTAGEKGDVNWTAVAFQQMSPSIRGLGERIEYLFDYHDKLISMNERRLARHVLRITARITCRYIGLRANSTLALPSIVPFVNTSDSHRFVRDILEGYLARAKTYIRSDDNEGITAIVWIFAELAEASAPIRPINDDQSENPIFEQCRGYLDQIASFAATNRHIESLFQIAGVLGRMGPMVIEHRLQYELLPVFQSTYAVAFAGVLGSAHVVWDRCMDVFVAMMQGMSSSRHRNLEVHLRGLFEHLLLMVMLIVRSNRIGKGGNSLSTNMKLNSPFQQVQSIVTETVSCTADSESKAEELESKRALLAIVESYRAFLRSLSEQMKSADELLVGAVGRSIAYMGKTLMMLAHNDLWEAEREKLVRLVGWYVHQPGWFVHHASEVKTSSEFNKLVDAVAEIGFDAARRKEDELVGECVNAIKSIASAILDKESSPQYGFSGPRVMLRACFVAILAQKLGLSEVIEGSKLSIHDFETDFKKKWCQGADGSSHASSPREDQLSLEVAELHERCVREGQSALPGLMASAEDRLLEAVEPQDIDDFSLLVWGFKVSERYGFGYF